MEATSFFTGAAIGAAALWVVKLSRDGFAFKENRLLGCEREINRLRSAAAELKADLQAEWRQHEDRLGMLELDVRSRALRVELKDLEEAQGGRIESWINAAQRQDAERDAAINAANEAVGALEDSVKEELGSLAAAQGETLAALDQQLQAMQAFIVQAAEQARERRVAVSSANLTELAGPGGAQELAELVALQRQAQEAFAARRRADTAAGFQQPAGGGL